MSNRRKPSAQAIIHLPGLSHPCNNLVTLCGVASFPSTLNISSFTQSRFDANAGPPGTIPRTTSPFRCKPRDVLGLGLGSDKTCSSLEIFRILSVASLASDAYFATSKGSRVQQWFSDLHESYRCWTSSRRTVSRPIHCGSFQSALKMCSSSPYQRVVQLD